MTDHLFLTSATNAVDVYMIKQRLVQLWPHISAHVGGRKKDWHCCLWLWRSLSSQKRAELSSVTRVNICRGVNITHVKPAFPTHVVILTDNDSFNLCSSTPRYGKQDRNERNSTDFCKSKTKICQPTEKLAKWKCSRTQIRCRYFYTQYEEKALSLFIILT